MGGWPKLIGDRPCEGEGSEPRDFLPDDRARGSRFASGEVGPRIAPGGLLSVHRVTRDGVGLLWGVAVTALVKL